MKLKFKPTIPILWRWIIKAYLQTLCTVILTFIPFFFILKIRVIYSFFVMGGSVYDTLTLFMLRLPYVIAKALPISCLMAAFLVMQNLKRSHQLTVLKSAGMSLVEICYPIYWATLVISLLNLYCIFTLDTICKNKSTQIITNSIASNIVHLANSNLLSNKCFTKYDNIAHNIVSDFFYVTVFPHTNHLTLTHIDKCIHDQKHITLENLSQISYPHTDDKHLLIVDHQKQNRTTINDILNVMHHTKPKYKLPSKRPPHTTLCIKLVTLLSLLFLTALGIAYGATDHSKYVLIKVVVIGAMIVIADMLLQKHHSAAYWVYFIPQSILFLLISLKFTKHATLEKIYL